MQPKTATSAGPAPEQGQGEDGQPGLDGLLPLPGQRQVVARLAAPVGVAAQRRGVRVDGPAQDDRDGAGEPARGAGARRAQYSGTRTVWNATVWRL
jgi:hypothetical protein